MNPGFRKKNLKCKSLKNIYIKIISQEFREDIPGIICFGLL
jgi:hypothetical protein